MRRSVFACSLVATALPAAALFAIQQGVITVPEKWNPWAPLSVAAEPSLLTVAAEPSLLTRFKLARLDAGDACRLVLAQTALQYQPVADRETGPGCGLRDAVQLSAVPGEVGEPFALTCRAAVTLALWERHVVQPAAQQHFGQPVRRFEHFGSYACRNVYGRPDATRSRHATAEAWDVAGFVLEDGRRIRVAGDWQGEGVDARFLRDVARGACRFFDAVLSPDYNAAHHDHLHLDRGPYRICR